MVAINRRTLATKQLATLLHKHTNTLDANVQHMKEALDATTLHGQSNMKMLHTIEGNEKEARTDIKQGIEKLAELHHQATVFEQNQNQLRMSAHANSQAVHLLEHGQKQHKMDLRSLKEHGKLLDKLVHETSGMASTAESKANLMMKEKNILQENLQHLEAKFKAVTSGSQNKKRMTELQGEADALKLQQKATAAKIDEALKVDQMSVKIQNETAQTEQAVTDLSDKTADIEIHQEKMVKTTAFGLMCVVIAVFFLACFMMGQLRRLNEKIEHTVAGRARGSGN